jgi:predicted AAA+ superfamily ATPase
VKLLAGRVGQLINHNSLAGDVGIDAKTVRHWLSILEASFIIFKLPPYFKNFGKRAIKSPKYYFTDTGLLSNLLGIYEASQITRDPLVGNLFENLVVLEAMKSLHNQGRLPNLYFFCDGHGNEIDLLHDAGRKLMGIEIKSGATYHRSFKKSLLRFNEKVAPLAKMAIVYNGERQVFSDGIEALPFYATHELFNE